ncbi:acyl-ACP--UDP-N-acetylglucosamine O-acyltransferase [Flavobacterium sp. UW10123]|uniref:acyl-ACP--UDP-N-acetylglucosamine O-acyltransferase n=1 Tax=Flavobacterium sp. UW10123 TaxID=3230800 RepID=UPI0033957B56
MKNTFIDKNAILGNNILLGNNVVIEQDVVIGNNTEIGNNVTILSGSRIGESCQIYSNVVLGGIPQDLKYKGEYTFLEIGDNNIIREFVTINKGTISKGKTSIGNSNLIMSNAHIGHDCVIGNNSIIGFSVGMAGEVIVEDWVNISGLTAIHQFSVIGEHAMVSGLSRVVKDIPPYVVAAHEPLRFAGLNTVGLKRRGFDSRKIDVLQSIYRVLFQERRNTKFALEIINEKFEKTVERDKILNFVRQSKRGIIKGVEF